MLRAGAYGTCLSFMHLGDAFLFREPYPVPGDAGGPGFPGGTSGVKVERDQWSGLFSAAEVDGTLEAGFLLKTTGIPLAAWTRNPVPQEIISVMAATLWGSLDTMIRTLGGSGPRYAMLEVDERRILISQVGPGWTLLLVAPRSVGKRRLRGVAQRLVARVVERRNPSLGRPSPVEVLE